MRLLVQPEGEVMVTLTDRLEKQFNTILMFAYFLERCGLMFLFSKGIWMVFNKVNHLIKRLLVQPQGRVR